MNRNFSLRFWRNRTVSFVLALAILAGLTPLLDTTAYASATPKIYTSFDEIDEDIDIFRTMARGSVSAQKDSTGEWCYVFSRRGYSDVWIRVSAFMATSAKNNYLAADNAALTLRLNGEKAADGSSELVANGERVCYIWNTRKQTETALGSRNKYDVYSISRYRLEFEVIGASNDYITLKCNLSNCVTFEYSSKVPVDFFDRAFYRKNFDYVTLDDEYVTPDNAYEYEKALTWSETAPGIIPVAEISITNTGDGAATLSSYEVRGYGEFDKKVDLRSLISVLSTAASLASSSAVTLTGGLKSLSSIVSGVSSLTAANKKEYVSPRVDMPLSMGEPVYKAVYESPFKLSSPDDFFDVRTNIGNPPSKAGMGKKGAQFKVGFSFKTADSGQVITTKKEYSAPNLISVPTTLTFRDLSVPTNLQVGDSGNIGGWIDSSNSPICSVRAEVLDASGGVVMTANTNGFSVQTYGPLNNSKINTDLKFNQLVAGSYRIRYAVTAKDGTSNTTTTKAFSIGASVQDSVAPIVKPVTVPSNAEQPPQVTEYFDCNVRIYTTEGQAVNAYANIFDTTRKNWFDRGQTLRSVYGAKTSDGATWYQVNAVNAKGNPVSLWVNAASPGATVENLETSQEIAQETKPNCDNGHTWGTWDVVKAASCETIGRRQRICSMCKEAEAEAIASLGHVYQVTEERDTATIYACRRCGDSYTEETDLPATSGTMDNFVFANRYTAETFRDVMASDWFQKNVATVYKLGLMKGTGEGIFSSGNNITVAEAVTLAARIHSLYHTGEEMFPRYDGGSWYDPYVDYARENRIIDVNYDYHRPATREEFVHILARALPETELENIAGRVTFTDSRDITYIADIRLLSCAGIINGIPEGGKIYFKPTATITRAEVAAVVARMARPDTRIKQGGPD